MMLQLTDKIKIYFYLIIFITLLSLHNINLIKSFDDFFKISKIEIKGNIDKKLSNDILLSLKRYYDFNIFWITSDQIKAELDSFNTISEYKVKKQYPSIIQIDLKETNILAYFFDNNQKFFIGENGKKIKHTRKNYNTLPLIVGEVDIKRFLSLKNILIDNNFELKDFDTIYSFKSKRWDLSYKKNLKVKLPLEDYDYSIKIFKQIIENKDTSGIKIIDLRIKNKIIYS